MKKLLSAILVSLGLFGIVQAAEIEDLNTTDASNTARFPENMAPSAVNNGARALEGILARFYNDLGCRISTAGSSNAYTLAASQAITSYFDGLILCFDASFPNTATATLNVDGKGAKTLKRNGANLPAGTIETGQKVLVTYDGTNFEILSVARAVTSIGTLSSNADEILTSDGTNATFSAITSYLSTQGELEIGSAVTGYTSPGRQQFHPSAAKAWVYFEGDAGTPDNTKVVVETGKNAFKRASTVVNRAGRHVFWEARRVAGVGNVEVFNFRRDKIAAGNQ